MPSAFPSLGRCLLFALLGLLIFCSWSILTPAQAPQRLVAPELEGGVGWLGIDRPLLLKDLRGKFVVFDFWTLC